MEDGHKLYCRDPNCATKGSHVLSDDCEQMWPNCPQCGEPTRQLFEGYCGPCCTENQRRLDEHNAYYDAWQSMTDTQRDAAIKRACR
jgi:hypothetical protein